MRIVIGSDHAGFALKEAVKLFLTAEDREVLDLGTHSTDPVDYSDYAEAVGQALRDKRAERGILLCGSGVGASMAANRIPISAINLRREGKKGWSLTGFGVKILRMMPQKNLTMSPINNTMIKNNLVIRKARNKLSAHSWNRVR